MIIPGAEPFLLKGGDHGVLLIHGFTGNPAELLLLGKHLQAQGFAVLGIRLAGHATKVQDLEHMTKDDWIASTLDGYSILRGCCDKISVVGHSMGGLLSLHLAAMANVDINRLVTLAAPIFIDESRGLNMLPPREQSHSEARRHLKNVPTAVNRVYKRMPLVSVHELIELLETVKSELSKVKTSIMIVQGKEDRTVKTESAEYIYNNVTSPERQIELIDGMGHLLPLQEGREEVFKLVEEFLKRGTK